MWQTRHFQLPFSSASWPSAFSAALRSFSFHCIALKLFHGFVLLWLFVVCLVIYGSVCVLASLLIYLFVSGFGCSCLFLFIFWFNFWLCLVFVWFCVVGLLFLQGAAKPSTAQPTEKQDKILKILLRLFPSPQHLFDNTSKPLALFQILKLFLWRKQYCFESS